MTAMELEEQTYILDKDLLGVVVVEPIWNHSLEIQENQLLEMKTNGTADNVDIPDIGAVTCEFQL